MEAQKYFITISPQVIINKIKNVVYTAGTEVEEILDLTCCDFTSYTQNIKVITGETKVQLPMIKILSGGTEGVSTLTGLTLPILLTQTINDIGYYDTFDGAIQQKEVVNNFVFTSTTIEPYRISLLNTSEKQLFNYLKITKYYLDWGDGSPIIELTSSGPFEHQYPNTASTYLISLSGDSIWGTTITQRYLTLPYVDVIPSNPNGNILFVPNSGSWSGIPIDYNYIYNYDSSNDLNTYVGSSFIAIPFILSSETTSNLADLRQYGITEFKLNQQVKVQQDVFGTYWGRNGNDPFVSYTINDIDYYDFDDGTTISVVESQGLISDWITLSGLTKQESLLNVIDPIQIQSNVFIERGRVSPFEQIDRLNEVSSVGGLTIYGYKFFNVKIY